MSKNLVIVESPAKVKTISKFLGKDWTIEASYGHVIDLPKSNLGIDVDKDFDGRYITIRGKGQLLNKLKRLVKNAENIYLATDPDREGETISWHLKNNFKLNDKQKLYRISFNEITKNAVLNAIKNPRKLDINLINSQQARRFIDRIVGYGISPILWEKIKKGLSAGRVQSVALKLICDREKLINDFVPEEYWTLDVGLITKSNQEFNATFYKFDDKKIDVLDKIIINQIKDRISEKKLIVKDIKNSTREKKPPLPFTTSTLQQVAGKTLNFPVAKTMSIAQKLYEGVDLKQKGTTSLITYLRTDSTRISEEAKDNAKNYIEHNIGHSYLGDDLNQSKTKNEQKIQDAHEAIRPTYIDIEPDDIKESLSRDEYRLYNLIWKRFLASRMSNAIYDVSKIILEKNGVSFTSTRSKIRFDGFLKVYKEQDEDEIKTSKMLKISIGDEVVITSINDEQHFTSPPPHFTESSLVKILEEDGIGRPSTYAPTIQTLLKRRYITREKKNLFSTEIGQVVNEVMKNQFMDIVDEKFTANMEARLDDVEQGKLEWKQVLRDFYPDFKSELDNALKKLEKIKIEDEVSDEICDKCGANMVVKYGPFGKFLACPNFPECKNTKNYLERTGYLCPKCKKHELIKLRTKKGRIFFACEDQECDYKTWNIEKDTKQIEK